jgi:hypothetical protein
MDDIKKFIRYNSDTAENFDSNCEVISSSDVDSYIYDIYYEVDKAKDLLENIKNVADLSNINECLELLQKLSKNLY